jgi:hypothetical protein
MTMNFLIKPVLFIGLVLSILFIISCKKDRDTPEMAIFDHGGGKSMIVTVLNEAGNPVNGANVSCGTIKAVTGIDGKATLQNVVSPTEKYSIKVERSGYFSGHKNVMKINDNGSVYADIKLIEQQLLGNINANSATNLNGDKFRVELNGQGFKDSSGNSVSGSVSVYARYVSAENLERLAELMPGGDFAAVNQNGNTGILESYGFTAIEFRDVSGSRVVPQSGSAQVAIQVTPEAVNQINNGGASFWFFDETRSQWVFVSDVNLSNNEVFMPVTEAVFGNCDRMNARATFKAKFYCDTINNPVAGKTLKLKGQSGYAMIYTSQSNANGNVLVEVGIPSTGGTYELSIDGFTTNVTFSPNEVTDLGSIDVCNLQGADGSPRFNLKWSAPVDLDLYVKTPSGEIISYSKRSSSDGGALDIDCICSCEIPSENIFWDPVGPSGTYTYWVEYFDFCEDNVVPADFTIVVRDNNALVVERTGSLTSVKQKSQEWTFIKQ